MKKFIIRITAFLLIIFVVLASYETYNLFSNKYIKWLDGSAIGVYHSISKSKQNKKVKKLLIGDSVANQLYSNLTCNDSIYSLACNQAITVAGHFFLLNNFINANRNELPGEVILFYNPNALQNNLDKHAFPYFLKPFYNDEYKHLIDTLLAKKIETIPLYFVTQLPFIRTTNYTPEFCVPQQEEFDGLFSPLTKVYLKKIENMCKINGIKFQFKPTPISKTKWEQLPENSDYPIDTMLINNYFQNIRYCEDSLFSDEIHFKRQYIPKDYLKLTCN